MGDYIMNRIKDMRNESNKTQSQVANYIGISQQSYARYETENLLPASDIILKLARYYNVTTDYLLGNSEQREPSPITEERLLKLGFSKEKVDKLTPEDIIRIRAYLEGILDSKK